MSPSSSSTPNAPPADPKVEAADSPSLDWPATHSTKRQISPTSSRNSATGSGPRAKRKRLTKACDSCHKSKRRCDGTSPCANCDFAGKTCVYTDSSGRAIEPPVSKASAQAEAQERDRVRKTAGAVTPSAAVAGSPEGLFGTYDSPHPSLSSVSSLRTQHQAVRPSAFDQTQQFDPHLSLYGEHQADAQQHTYPSHTTLLEPGLTKELVNLFFAHMHPFNLVLHRSTFLTDLIENRIPPYLLRVVFALAAPLSVQPKIRTSPPWKAGERFAQAALAELFDADGTLKQKPTIEVAQALALLTMHECIVRTPNQTGAYFRIALRILEGLGIHTLDQASASIPSGFEQETNQTTWIARESYRRLFYLIYVIELLSAVFTQRPLSYSDHQLKVYLPVDEASFELILMNQSGPREYPIPQHPLLNGRSTTAEFGFLVRVTTYYAKINGYLRVRSIQNASGAMASPGTHAALKDCEASLTAWEKSLPDHLRFNEDNLHVQVSTLESGGGVGGWSYCYMHALAECCVLALHECLEVDGDRQGLRDHSLRQQRALDNLTVILGSLGTRGRLNIMMATVLLAVVKHRTALSGQPDPHVTTWCAEYESLWGVNLEQMLSIEFRQSWVPPYPPDEMVPRRPSDSVGGLQRSLSDRSSAKNTSSAIADGSIDGRTDTEDGSSTSISSRTHTVTSQDESSRHMSPPLTPGRPPNRKAPSEYPTSLAPGPRSRPPSRSYHHHHASSKDNPPWPVEDKYTNGKPSSPSPPPSDLSVSSIPVDGTTATPRNHTSLPPLHSVGLLEASSINPDPYSQARLPSLDTLSRTGSPTGRSLFTPQFSTPGNQLASQNGSLGHHYRKPPIGTSNQSRNPLPTSVLSPSKLGRPATGVQSPKRSLGHLPPSSSHLPGTHHSPFTGMSGPSPVTGLSQTREKPGSVLGMGLPAGMPWLRDEAVKETLEDGKRGSEICVGTTVNYQGSRE